MKSTSSVRDSTSPRSVRPLISMETPRMRVGWLSCRSSMDGTPAGFERAAKQHLRQFEPVLGAGQMIPEQIGRVFPQAQSEETRGSRWVGCGDQRSRAIDEDRDDVKAT